MSRACLTLLALFAGLLPAFAQEPRLWRDPEQGCSYIITPQGGIGLRYRRDGSPDCPDWVESARPPTVVPSAAVAPRMVPVAPVIWSGTPRSDTPGVRPSESWPSARATDAAGVRPSESWPNARGTDGARSRAPLVWPGESSGEVARTREAMLVLPQTFGCWTAGEVPRGGMPAQVRVRVEPQARLILVEATGGREMSRYTLDSTSDVWFNGRNERDPRLGIILSPSRGHMWLDSATRPGVRGGDIVSQPFDCRPDGAVY